MTVALWIAFAICLTGTGFNAKTFLSSKVLRKNKFLWLVLALNVFVCVVVALAAAGV